MERCHVSLYTSLLQSEQPLLIRDVTALSFAGGTLTIECEVQEEDYTFSAYHRYLPGKWAHIEVYAKS